MVRPDPNPANAGQQCYAAAATKFRSALNEVLPSYLRFRPMDQSNIAQNRRSRRSPVLLAASVEVAGVPQAVKLRNLSEDGALIEGERLPLEGATTFFQRNDLRVKG